MVNNFLHISPGLSVGPGSNTTNIGGGDSDGYFGGNLVVDGYYIGNEFSDAWLTPLADGDIKTSGNLEIKGNIALVKEISSGNSYNYIDVGDVGLSNYAEFTQSYDAGANTALMYMLAQAGGKSAQISANTGTTLMAHISASGGDIGLTTDSKIQITAPSGLYINDGYIVSNAFTNAWLSPLADGDIKTNGNLEAQGNIAIHSNNNAANNSYFYVQNAAETNYSGIDQTYNGGTDVRTNLWAVSTSGHSWLKLRGDSASVSTADLEATNNIDVTSLSGKVSLTAPAGIYTDGYILIEGANLPIPDDGIIKILHNTNGFSGLYITNEANVINSYGITIHTLGATNSGFGLDLISEGTVETARIGTSGTASALMVYTSGANTSPTIKVKQGQDNAVLRLEGGTSGYVDILVPTAVTSYPITLPATQGAVDTFLKNNGSGALTWATSSGATNTVGTEGDIGTLTWTATSAPSGTITQRYKYTRVGGTVTLSWRIEASIAGLAVTAVSFELPGDVPSPTNFSNQSNDEWVTISGGAILSTTSATLVNGAAAGLYKNSGGIYEIRTYSGTVSVAAQFVAGTVTYQVDA